jgi:prepilin-type N-terminal cleavage/methylation domain-containing protein
MTRFGQLLREARSALAGKLDCHGATHLAMTKKIPAPAMPNPAAPFCTRAFKPKQAAGFTLLELLTVVALLATVSLVAWSTYTDVDRRAADELAHAELLKLARALQRFHNDTGFWPGEGPFRVVENCDTPASGSLTLSSAEAEAVDFPRQKAWFDSAVNLTLLFSPPTLCAGHPLAFLARWNPEAHRGWNGPYLPLAVRHWVEVSDTNDGENAFITCRTSGANCKLKNVPALGAGATFGRQGRTRQECNGGLDDCFLGWSSLPKSASFSDIDGDGADDTTGYNPAQHSFARHPRPLAFYRTPRPRVVYWGADGYYDGENPADICHANGDDLVVCL